MIPPPNKSFKKGEFRTWTDGRVQKILNKATGFGFLYKYENIENIDICNENFYNTWIDYTKCLNTVVVDYKFRAMLTYQITKLEDSFPWVKLDLKMLNFFASNSIEVDFDCYDK